MPAAADPDLERTCIDTIRTLAMDAVQAANSGHPGAPMALAPLACTLWQRHLNYDPADPAWPNRDRFVLSNGHASMLLYGLLHLAGVAALDPAGRPTGEPSVSLDDIRRFRQLDSRTPGHPESHLTSGVETTTGPLGQGVSTSVGMAIAERWLATRYNRPGFDLFDHRVYAICGDGDLMEGVSHEAASLAGHLGLSNLCWFYDDNGITIEGHTNLAFSEDVGARFAALGWHVVRVADANDTAAISAAIDAFHATADRPTLVIVRSHIAWGAPNKQDTAAAHGEPLGAEEVRLAKRAYGWPEDAQFLVPPGVREAFRDGVGRRGGERRAAWERLRAEHRARHPEVGAELDLLLSGGLPEGWDAALPGFPADGKGLATRESSGKVLGALAEGVPWVLGGSADLAPSTKTRLGFEGAGDFAAGHPGGRNFHFGIREHAMSAVLNGMALSHLRPYGSGFLIFSDYARGAIRLAALMHLPVIHVFTHDSIGVGEDGPTHQPIEQLAGLRAIPGMTVLRPADANEVVEAWRFALRHVHGPSTLVLTRQAVPTIDRGRYASAAGLARGGYVLADAPGADPEVILVGTGSEVSLCLAAHEDLGARGIRSRVVSLPSWELFAAQGADYRDAVLPPGVTARVSVEQASTFGWERWIGATGTAIGMHGFGASAPAGDLLRRFGFTREAVVAAALGQLGRDG